MKLGNIIDSAGQILNAADSVLLKRCANLVLGNIAVNYLDFTTAETFTVTNGQIDYSRFSKIFLRAKSVRINGAQIDFSLYMGYIAVPNGAVTVEYCYVPYFTSDADDIVIPGMTEQCFVYGVLTEYAIISGMFNEAKIWAEKFADGLFKNNPKYKKIRLPRT